MEHGRAVARAAGMSTGTEAAPQRLALPHALAPVTQHSPAAASGCPPSPRRFWGNFPVDADELAWEGHGAAGPSHPQCLSF